MDGNRDRDVPEPLSVREICRRIRAAFPTKTGFNYHVDTISAGFREENIDITNSLRGLSWEEVPFKTVRDVSTVLTLLSDAAYRYYLPAFMVASFEEADDIGIIEYVVQSLCPRPNYSVKNSIKRWKDRVSYFDSKQREVIVCFLEQATWHHYEHTTIDEGFDALTQFWYHGDGEVHLD